MSGEVMIRFLGTAVGIEGKPRRDFKGRQYGRSRMVSELAAETWLGWTSRLIFLKTFHKRNCVHHTW